MTELDDVFEGEDLGLGDPVINDSIIENNIIENDNIFDEPEEGIKDTSILDDFLKLKGLENNKITIREEDNTEKEVDFYELTKEEQLDLLAVQEETSDLDDSEIEFLNSIRSNNLTVDAFLEAYKAQILDEANVNNTQVESYEIDSYDDQELYLLDLKNKYDLTDEELVKELEKELQDEVLFKKKADKLRSEYKLLEDNYKETQIQEANQEKEAKHNQFIDQMVDIAIKTPDFYGIDLDNDEKNTVLSSILELDDNGISNFHKAITDPKELYRVAWFQKYGEEAFNVLKIAYEEEITRLKKDNRASVVVKNDRKINNIHELNY